MKLENAKKNCPKASQNQKKTATHTKYVTEKTARRIPGVTSEQITNWVSEGVLTVFRNPFSHGHMFELDELIPLIASCIDTVKIANNTKIEKIEQRSFKDNRTLVPSGKNLEESTVPFKIKFIGSLKDICIGFAQLTSGGGNKCCFQNTSFELANFIVDNFEFTDKESLSVEQLMNALDGRDFSNDISMAKSIDLLTKPTCNIKWAANANQLYYVLKKMHMRSSNKVKGSRKGICSSYLDIAYLISRKVIFKKDTSIPENLIIRGMRKTNIVKFKKSKRPDFDFHKHLN